MRLLRIVVIVVLALWIVVELVSIPLAEQRIEQEVARRNRDAASVQADIDSFPLVTGLLVTSEMRKLTVTLDQVARQRLTFTEVRFELKGVEVDRASLMRQQPRVDSIDEGTITGTLDLGALSEAIGRLPSITGGNVRVSGRTLSIGPVSMDITRDLFPCDPQARVDAGRVIVSCTIHDVPEALLDAAQR